MHRPSQYIYNLCSDKLVPFPSYSYNTAIPARSDAVVRSFALAGRPMRKICHSSSWRSRVGRSR